MKKAVHTFKNPQAFLRNLEAMNDSIFQIMEMSCEKECEYPNSEFRDMQLKSCDQVAGQFHRPDEFLESLIDMIRVTFQTQMFGNLFLNSNPAFLYEAIPSKPFILGYVSAVSKPGESFSDFWNNTIVKKPQLQNLWVTFGSGNFPSV